ncbi:type II toxin-antitoxin system HicB family antitoxin [Halorubrum laminariae]|uniref:Type II toxin-antitoxin system HicB family antitoxin n=1 Tax=Halorubrum laminariae TaxID=1433523 RepID=A0ABD6C399_9EURY|nr:hypothetical protein [Halorubrum laminariae]
MATTSENDCGDGVEFTYEADLVTARDVASGVTASGTSKPIALSRLADALTLHAGGGDPIDDEKLFLDEISVDADAITIKPPIDKERLAEGYRERAERSRQLAEEMDPPQG